MEALELALRSAMHQIGGVLLEKLLNSDEGGYGGTRIKCGQGHLAEFVDTAAKKSLRCFPGLRYNGHIITARSAPLESFPRIKSWILWGPALVRGFVA